MPDFITNAFKTDGVGDVSLMRSSMLQHLKSKKLNQFCTMDGYLIHMTIIVVLNIAAREGKLDGCILDEKLDNKSEQIHSK
jgi:hypothetical protein